MRSGSGAACLAHMLPPCSAGFRLPDTDQRDRRQDQRPNLECVSAGLHKHQGQRSLVSAFPIKFEFQPLAQPRIAYPGLVAPESRAHFAANAQMPQLKLYGCYFLAKISSNVSCADVESGNPVAFTFRSDHHCASPFYVAQRQRGLDLYGEGRLSAHSSSPSGPMTGTYLYLLKSSSHSMYFVKRHSYIVLLRAERGPDHLLLFLLIQRRSQLPSRARQKQALNTRKTSICLATLRSGRS
jgi:hypothetical protein